MSAGATSAASSAVAAAASQASGDGIRPATLRPVLAATANSGGAHPLASILAGSPDVGPPPPPPPDLPPDMSAPEGFAIDEPDPVNDPGQYVAESPVPIGARAVLTVTSPYGEENPITSFEWSGGSNYVQYFATPAANPPPPSMAAPAAPVTNAATYEFIVDATPGNYTVNINVAYQGEGTGSATLTYTSVAPTGSLAVKQVGTQTWGVDSVLLSPPIQISATSSVGQYTAGQFMFMQIINSTVRSYVDSTGQSWYIANSPAFPAVNGPLEDPTPSTGTHTAAWYTYNGLECVHKPKYKEILIVYDGVG